MPYLGSQPSRTRLDEGRQPLNGAELNYVLCRLANDFLTTVGGVSYETITAIRGAFVGALEEFERVIAGPYEEIKRKQNGDVWTHIPGQWTGGPTASP